MIWWLIGIWFAMVCVLSFVFGRLGWLTDADWGVFIAFGTAFWPLILLVIALVIICAIPCSLIFLFVRLIGYIGEKIRS